MSAANVPDSSRDGVRRENVAFCCFTNPFDISENNFDIIIKDFYILNYACCILINAFEIMIMPFR